MKKAKWIARFERLGVQVLDAVRVLLQCKACGRRWSPEIVAGGRLRRGAWHCPHGCNHGAQ